MRGGSPKCDLSLNALPDGRLRLQVALVGFDPPLARVPGSGTSMTLLRYESVSIASRSLSSGGARSSNIDSGTWC